MPVLNEEPHIERSIRAVLAQRFDRPMEVLVVDGGSDDRTPEILRRLALEDPRIRLLSNPKTLIPNALNVGLRHAKGEYIVRMDAHAEYPPDYIARAVARFEAGGVECVSGPPIPHGEDTWSRRVALALPSRLGMGGGMFRQPNHEIEVDTTFTGVWRRSTLLELGGWDERWQINEDSELIVRIRAAGGKCVSVPELAVRYFPRRSLSALARQFWRYGQYRAKTASYHPGGMRAMHLLPPGLVLDCLASVLGPRRTRRFARRALLVYAGALTVGTAEVAATRRADPGDLVWLPLVFAVMHLSWGAGFVLGSLRFGPPVPGLAGVLRRARRAR
jgi:glycosyltransferase involved in cell wall biosynthesis